MDTLRAAVAKVTERVARSRPVTALRELLEAQRPGDQGQGGQGLAEYALILAGIAIVAVASLIFLGGTITELFWDPISEDFAAVLSRLGI
jgi:Flp pilus assembly pilin Flp